ncbi:RNA polymerase Rpb7-like [Babesia duncani]|uniref:RNA polymerase Rpb7-like n=1 Tax=Babesia duncani TaxID=323732 RepID=A0AAD9PKZ0_9APIC|nr:RNA polymerase Rpb7-like [Babesia duncani]
MFKRYIVEDYIKLDVDEYLKDSKGILSDKLIEKYTDRLLENIGLVILVEDYHIKYDPRINQTDCSALYCVNVKLLCFSPSLGDVFPATVIAANEGGLTGTVVAAINKVLVSVGFFDDIRIIPAYMNPTCIL